MQQQQWTISWSDCDMWWKVDFIWQLVMTTSVVGLRRSSKALAWKERSWSPFGGLVLDWYTTAFWIPAKPSHLRSRLSKPVRYTENCNACSWHWLTERAKFFSAAMPDCTSHNQCFKSWTNWATKFHLCHIQLTSCQPTGKILQASWQLFLQRKNLHNQQEAENPFQEFVKSQSIDFYAIGINELISHWQRCLDCNGLYFD